MKLFLVRHGQSTGNIGGALMGQSDHPLTELGERQAAAAAAWLSPHGPMPVYCSDLPRAAATAERIAAVWAAGRPDGARVVLDPRLREISLGDYEGRPWQEFEADEALTAAFAADPYGTALPNGESLAHVEARVHAAVVDIVGALGFDDCGAPCSDAVRHADAGAVERDLEAMRAGAEAAAVGDRSADAGLAAGAMQASALASGFLAAQESGNACLVGHDGSIRAALNHYLGVPPQKWWTLSTTHGGISMLEFAGGCVTARFVNATGHLEGLATGTPGEGAAG